MGIRFITKKCPNCGENLKFNVNDTSVTCMHCKTHTLIEYEKQNMYTQALDSDVKKLYVNKVIEIYKLIINILLTILITIVVAYYFLLGTQFGFVLILIVSVIPIKWLDRVPPLNILSIIFRIGLVGLAIYGFGGIVMLLRA